KKKLIYIFLYLLNIFFLIYRSHDDQTRPRQCRGRGGTGSNMMAAQQAGYEAQRRLNQQMMEMMQRMYPNEGPVPRNFPMKIPSNISSELPRIGPSENPSKYPEEALPQYIPRSFPTNRWSSEFPRKFVSSEFRRKISRDFRGKLNFRGVISEDLFRRLQARKERKR
uniref:Uncharacterized protein n=1 Tax=Brassica oleracea var. oleracea TaxID=109376 RepID=A0A0D3E7G1_BRAOL